MSLMKSLLSIILGAIVLAILATIYLPIVDPNERLSKEGHTTAITNDTDRYTITVNGNLILRMKPPIYILDTVGSRFYVIDTNGVYLIETNRALQIQ